VVDTPTAGIPKSGNPEDSNGDGLPDAWQIQYFGSFSSPDAAPGADPDHDGFANLQEYLAGTNPTNAASCLRFDLAEFVGGSTVLHFTAAAGKSYTILYKANLSGGVWLNLTNVAAQPVNGPVTVSDPVGGGNRFYRLLTPALVP
jgi:hypothetical protein